MGLLDRLQHAWNAFISDEKTQFKSNYVDLGLASSYRPDRMYFTKGNERSIITSVYNRIAIDCASLSVKHVRVDEEGRYLEDINSSLNNCLTLEANKDQTSRFFFQDLVQTIFDEGCAAIVPIDTSINPAVSNSYDIESMRVGKIITWYPDKVKVNVYDDRSGLRKDVIMNKKDVAIIENPLYSIMNERNSTLQRLIRKLNILDAIDEQSGSGKLDLIIQLPYVIKTTARQAQAEERRKDIERQLSGSKYGIAYTDGTEKITQLNRPVENNIQKQIEYLTSMLYGQLGMTTEVLDGSADEKTMMNYMIRTVEPIVAAYSDEMNRKFITKTGRTQGQRIMYFNDPFKLIPVTSLADIADKLTRNAIVSTNEIRQKIGMKPSSDPDADSLRNKNLNKSSDQIKQETQQVESEDKTQDIVTQGGQNQNG